MTKDEIIEMARKAGGIDLTNTTADVVIWIGTGTSDFLDAFAKLIAEKERMACAKIVEESSLPDTYSQECLPDIANEIRAREAITTIKEALAQSDEPFEYWNAVEGWVKLDEVKEHLDSVGCGTIYKTSGEDRVPLYTKTQIKGCAECGVSGGHAFYCVACAKKLFGGYKESESFDRTASHMANEYVEYKELILTDAEISESYYEVFKTAMIDIKAFEFAYSLLRKAQKK